MATQTEPHDSRIFPPIWGWVPRRPHGIREGPEATHEQRSQADECRQTPVWQLVGFLDNSGPYDPTGTNIISREYLSFSKVIIITAQDGTVAPEAAV